MPTLGAVLVTMTAVQLVSAAIGWLAEYSREHERARTLVALLRLAGPGAVLIDKRTDGAVLSLHSDLRSAQVWRTDWLIVEDGDDSGVTTLRSGSRQGGG